MMVPELVDYIELAKVLKHEFVLTNPMYYSFGLDQVICDVCKIAWKMEDDDGKKVASIFRIAMPADQLTEIELTFMATKEVRTKAFFDIAAKAFTKEGSKWTTEK